MVGGVVIFLRAERKFLWYVLPYPKYLYETGIFIFYPCFMQGSIRNFQIAITLLPLIRLVQTLYGCK